MKAIVVTHLDRWTTQGGLRVPQGAFIEGDGVASAVEVVMPAEHEGFLHYPTLGRALLRASRDGPRRIQGEIREIGG